MTDIAQLGIAVDTSQTKLAARELDNLVQAGGRAEGATKSLGNTSRQSMAEVASAAAKAQQAMQRMADSQERQERLMQQMSRQMDALTSAMQSNATANNAAAKASENAAQAMGQEASASKSAQAAAQGHAQAATNAAASSGQMATQAAAAGSAVGGMAGRLMAAASAAMSLNKAMQDMDAWTNMNNRIKLVTEGQDQFVQAQTNIIGIANSTRQPLKETAELYQRMAGSQKALGLSGADLAGVVQTISQSMVISGTSAASGAAALMQLGQAFNSGVLRGEEFNSVMEQAPGLMQAIAAGMGKTVGEMRGLAEAGKLTAEAVVKALQSQSGAVAENFAKMGSTIGQSGTVFNNKMTEFIGRMDDATGISKALANGVIGLSDNMGALATGVGTLVAFGLATWLGGVATAAGGVGVAFTAAGVAAKGLLASIGPAGWLILGLGAAATAWQLMGDKAEKSGIQMDSAGSAAKAAGDKLVTGITPAIDQAIKAYDKLIHKQKEALGTADSPLKDVAKGVKEADLNLQKLAQQVARAQKGSGEYVNMGPAQRAAAEKALTDELEKASKKRSELASKEIEYNKNVVAAYTSKEDRLTEAEMKAQKRDKAKEARDKALAAAGNDRVAQERVNAAYRTEIAKIEEDASKKGASAAKAAAREAKQAAKDETSALSELSGLSATYYKQLENYQKRRESGRFTEEQYIAAIEKLIQKQPFAIAQAKAQAEAWKEQEKVRKDASKAVEKAYEDEVKAAEKSGQQITNKVAQLNIEESAIALSKEQNVSLAQAIELVNIKRLEELQIIARTEGKQELVDSIHAEIEARKELADLTGRKETREAGKKAADEAVKDWKQAIESIEKDLTNALMRGFESGKDFAKNMRDTIANMFKTLVLRPTISAVMSPISGAMAGGNAAGGGGGASSALSAASSLFGAGGMAGSLAAGAGWMTGATTLSGALGAGTSLIGTGTLAGAASGAGMIVGALAPIALGIGALVAIGNATRGETRTGSRLETTSAGTLYAEGPSGGRLNAALENKMADAAFKGINNLFANLGSKEVLGKFVSGLETSDKGRGGVFAGGALSSGATFGDVQAAKEYKFNANLKAEDAIKAYAGELNIATIEALKAATDLPKYAQRVLGGLDTKKLTPDAAVEALQVISEYPSKILELVGTSRDALVQKFAEGMMDKEVGAQKAGQNVANMLVASIEQSVYQRGMGQIFDTMNQGIITPILDAMVTGTALSEAISQESIDATIARATAAATALGDLFKNEQFQGVLTGLKTTLGAALGGVAGQVGYEPKYQIAAAKETEKAAEEAEKAAEEARKKWQDITDNLLSDKTDLGIELMRAMGNEEGALAAEREKAIKDFDAYQIGLYDANRAMEKQIATLQSLNALREEAAGLEIDLLRAQGDNEAALRLERERATKGMTDAEIAAYDYNRTLEKQIATQESLTALQNDGASLQIELARALGKEESALSQERAIAIKGMGDLEVAQYDANQSARKLIGQVQSLSSAFDAAVNTLASPEQKMSMGYTQALGTLSKYGIDMDAAQAQTYTNAQLLEFVGTVSQMGDVSGQTRAEVIGAVQAIGELNNQALSKLTEGIQKESDKRIAAWEKEKSIAQERAGIEQTVLQALGNTTALRERELNALDASNRGLQQRAWALEDASAGVDKALALVQRSVDAQKKSISETAQAQIDAINAGAEGRNKAVDAAKKSVTDLTSIFDDIASAVKTLRQQAVPEAMQIAQARAYISMALSVAKGGGSVNPTNLRDAMSVVTKDTADTYRTGAEFRFAQAKQASELEQLAILTGGQKDVAQATLDAAERAVTAAQDQIKAIEKARDDQLKTLDAQLQAAQDSVSVMRGVDISVIGVSEAVGALDRAMADYEVVRDELAREQLTAGQDAVNRLDAMIIADQKNTTDTIAAINEQASSIASLGAAISQQAAAQAAAAAAAASIAIQNASNVSYGASAEGTPIGGYGPLPSFAVGTNYVPYDMIAQIHEGEAIVPREFNPAAFGNPSSNAELLSLVASLTKEVQRLQGLVQDGNSNLRRTADAVNGRPEAPMLVESV